MSIFVTGDIHRIAEYGTSRFSSRSWPRGRELTRDDVVIVAGDFGFVWKTTPTLTGTGSIGSNPSLGPRVSWTATMRIISCCRSFP